MEYRYHHCTRHVENVYHSSNLDLAVCVCKTRMDIHTLDRTHVRVEFVRNHITSWSDVFTTKFCSLVRNISITKIIHSPITHTLELTDTLKSWDRVPVINLPFMFVSCNAWKESWYVSASYGFFWKILQTCHSDGNSHRLGMVRSWHLCWSFPHSILSRIHYEFSVKSQCGVSSPCSQCCT